MSEPTYVLPMSMLPVINMHSVLGISEHKVEVASGDSWPEAAQKLVELLEPGPVVCDSLFSFVARGHGWQVGTAPHDVLVYRTAFALAWDINMMFSNAELAATTDYVNEWVRYCGTRMWERLPSAEILVLERTAKNGKVTSPGMTVVGASHEHWGFAYFNDAEAAVQLMVTGEETKRHTGLFVVGCQHEWYKAAFNALGVPPADLRVLKHGKEERMLRKVAFYNAARLLKLLNDQYEGKYGSVELHDKSVVRFAPSEDDPKQTVLKSRRISSLSSFRPAPK